MKKTKVYLASRSKARKALLLSLGITCIVMPSRIKEKRSRGRASYPSLVKHNALRKAVDVASRIRKGVIIAADTITVQEGTVFGKPRSIPQARRMLKRLSRRPQQVYTGLAVIVQPGGQRRVACERTDVYMDRLSDQEIDDYFAETSPLDKAGAFDIQGRGAVFIRRIEGCFYNVVGLPLRTLHRMCKELKIRGMLSLLVIAVVSMGLSGCATEYNIVTNREEAYYYSTDREVQIGTSIAKGLEAKNKLLDDALVQQRVKTIGEKLVGACDRKDIDYHFRVLDDEEINAVSLPGGFVYVNKGLIEKVKNDDQLASVLAHEVAHIVARHSIKKLQGMMSYTLARLATIAIPGTGEIGAAADVAFTELLLGYSREDELLADQLAARYLRLAGYNPQGMIDFLEMLQETQRRKPLRPKSYFKTHPYVPDRIRTVKEELGLGMEFDDYINIEQEKR